MPSTPSNAINESTTGVVGFTGTSFTATPVTQFQVLIGGATSSTVAGVAVGTAAQVLTSNGAGMAPTFQALPGTTLLTVTPVSSSPYVVLTTDDFLAVDSSGGAITVQLPNAPATGRSWIVKDKTGSAATHNITITTVGGAVNIDGATTFVMNTAYESANVIFDGTTYEVY